MAKRKTLKQKQKADMRRTSQPSPEHVERPVSYTFSSTEYKPVSTEAITLPGNYVKHDIVKTTLVSATIIALELLLFLMLHQHILKIPFVAY